MQEESRAWPFIRAIAKALTIPGTNIGLSILTDLQDQLSADDFQQDLKEALDEIRNNTMAVIENLNKSNIEVSNVNVFKEAAIQLGRITCYDVFVSYSHKELDWVRNWLVPHLEQEQLRVCIDFRNFEIGLPILINMERAIEHSHILLLVLTPNWIKSEWAKFETLMAQVEDPANLHQSILPLLLEPCELPRHLRILTYADFTRPEQREAEFRRLIQTIGIKKRKDRNDFRPHTSEGILPLLDDPERVYTPLRCTRSWEAKGEEAQEVLNVTFELLSSGGRPIVVGTYGTGKSFFAQKLYLLAKSNSLAQTVKRPVLLSLRDFHFARGSSRNLLDAVWDVLSTRTDKPSSRRAFFEDAKMGKILFILDGLDEVPYVQSTQGAHNSISACLELARVGKISNEVLITSRLGIVNNLSNYDCTALYLQPWEFRDFEEYVYKCEKHLAQLKVDHSEFLSEVQQKQSLLDLVKRPLYARMVVQFADYICSPGNNEIDEVFLCDRFVKNALKTKRSVYKNVEGKIDCLMFVAGRLFEKGVATDPIDNLRDAADRVLGHDSNNLRKFFETEILVYSLMTPVSEGRLSFSHETIRDFFLAKYLCELWKCNSLDRIEHYLDSPRSLSQCAVRMLCQMFKGCDHLLGCFAQKTLNHSQSRRVKGNCALLLIQMNKKPAELKNCDFIGADFSGVDVRDMYFKNCVLTGCNLDSARFDRVCFDGCILSDLDISGTSFCHCDFSWPGTELSQFKMADERPARFVGAIFKKARVTSRRNDNTKEKIEGCLKRESDSPLVAKSELKMSLNSLEQARH